MTPTDYLREIVMPAFGEFASNPGNLRLAYSASQTSFHLCDWIEKTDGIQLRDVRAEIRNRDALAYDVVDGICNGSKHCGRDSKRGGLQYKPGDERPVDPFKFGDPLDGPNRMSTGALDVDHDGKTIAIDVAVRRYLNAAKEAFPTHFSGILV